MGQAYTYFFFFLLCTSTGKSTNWLGIRLKCEKLEFLVRLDWLRSYLRNNIRKLKCNVSSWISVYGKFLFYSYSFGVSVDLSIE